MTISRPSWRKTLSLAVTLLAGLALSACALGLPDNLAVQGKTLERAQTMNGYN
jgi:hypothetical protein